MRQQEQEKKMLEIIHKLETDQYYAVKVVNTDTNAELGNNLTGQKMISDFGSVEDFFKYLISRGVTRITIFPKRKNGSTYIFKGEPETFQISNDNTTYQPETTPVATPLQHSPVPVQQNISIPVMPSNTGLNGSFGLGFTEVVGLHVAANEKGRLEAENDYLKKDNERLKAENQELKEDRLKKEYDTAKASGNKELLLGLGETLSHVIGKFMGGPAAVPTGLNGPAHASQEPSFSQSPELSYLATQSPDFLQFITGICHLINTSPDFYQDLTVIIQKYQPNATDNNNNSGN